MKNSRFRNALFLASAVLLAAMSGGCSNAPTAEIKVFRESVTSANTAATPLLDELSATERKLRSAAIDDTATKMTFDITEVGYFSDIGDAPGTAVLRRAHNILDRFSDILLGLATGSNVDSDVSGVESLVTEAAGFVEAVSAPMPAVATAAASIPAVFKIAEPGLKIIATAASHREARRVIQLAVDAKVVPNLTKAFEAAAPSIFNVMTQDALDASKNPDSPLAVRQVARAAYIDRTKKVRVLVSNYIVLIQRVNAAWNDVATASVQKTTISVTVLNDRIADLQAAVIATRKAYADLHAASTATTK